MVATPGRNQRVGVAMTPADSFADRSHAHPYQDAAFRRLRDLEYAGVFHEQGLGKTKIGLSIALHWFRRSVADAVLVITKRIIIPTWLQEVRKHTELVAVQLGPHLSSAAMSLAGPGRFFITNYEQLPKLEDLLKRWLKARAVGVILDESHAIKNPDREVSVLLRGLRTKFVRRLIMTGTPAANRPYDMWNQIHFLDGGKTFGTDYDTAKRELDLPKSETEAAQYALRLERLNVELALFTSRETKAQAGIDLPPKYVHTWSAQLEPRQALLYADYAAEARVLVTQSDTLTFDDTTPIIKRIARLLECVANPAALDQSYGERPGKDTVLLDVLAHEVHGDKAIVWTAYRANTERLRTVVGVDRNVVIHGGVPTPSRLRRLERFCSTAGPQVLIATPTSCKEGLTLTQATHVVYYDRSLSLDDYEQSQDRIHRISQSRTCHVHRIIATDTVDEWVDILLKAKKTAASIAQGDVGAKALSFDWMSHRAIFLQMLKGGADS